VLAWDDGRTGWTIASQAGGMPKAR
jgi:hypothetical protein